MGPLGSGGVGVVGLHVQRACAGLAQGAVELVRVGVCRAVPRSSRPAADSAATLAQAVTRRGYERALRCSRGYAIETWRNSDEVWPLPCGRRAPSSGRLSDDCSARPPRDPRRCEPDSTHLRGPRGHATGCAGQSPSGRVHASTLVEALISEAACERPWCSASSIHERVDSTLFTSARNGGCEPRRLGWRSPVSHQALGANLVDEPARASQHRSNDTPHDAANRRYRSAGRQRT